MSKVLERVNRALAALEFLEGIEGIERRQCISLCHLSSLVCKDVANHVSTTRIGMQNQSLSVL